MSFVRTLATLAVGFAAARGVDKFRQMGGLEGIQEAMKKAGAGQAGLGGQMAEMAEKLGMGGGNEALTNMMGLFNQQTKGASDAAQAGIGSLLSAMTGAAAAGAGGMSSMFEAMTAGTPVGAMAEENARLMIRAMIQAAKSDGEIDADEQKAILSHLEDASDEEITFVQAELNAPSDVAGLARDTGETAKAQVYSAALMAISVNTEAEKQYLATLASALGLETAKVRDIHAAMGKPSL
ncbi:tellurite resistance TerB family protein [Thalassovita sp.]|uniref:tellurite resistance TerB family protein n=1 Tax=Thalassovita sp. TaxID=1979401 RepID=UPI0029DE8269|nr:tellurite resistance TerB family protein [Thalassovita sp.]